MNFSKEDVLKALSTVEDPDLRKDLVSLNMIRDIEIDGRKLSFSIVLTTPACPLKEKLEQDCINAIHSLVAADIEVSVTVRSEVSSTRSDKVLLPGVKNIIAVASGKGGVGKSSVASNLAIALSQTGAAVGLLDADLYGPSIPMMFGERETQPMLRDVDGKQLMVPVEKYGIKLLSIGFLIKPGQAVAWRGPMLSSALRQFINETDWGTLDYLVLDLPPGTGDVHLSILQMLPLTGVVMVTTPQAVALEDAYKAASMFSMVPVPAPIFGVVENMSYFSPPELPGNKYYLFGQGGGREMATELNVPFLGEIPILAPIREGGDKGMPAALDQESSAGEAFARIAENIAQQISIKNAAKAEPVTA